VFAPLDEPGIVILLEVESVLPLSITASFRPRLRLMWPATSMSSNLSWDNDAHVLPDRRDQPVRRRRRMSGRARRVGDASGGTARPAEPVRDRRPSTR
jgi:hypothetical protein